MFTLAETIPDQLRQRARLQPDAPALVSPSAVFSYRELWGAIRELAIELETAGVKRLGLCGDNTPGWVIADLACLLAGIVCVPVPSFFSATQTEHLVRSAGLEGLLWASPGNPRDRRQKLTEAAWLQALPPLSPPNRPSPLPDGTAKITFTSGSTGHPRGVCLSAPQLAATTLALRNRLGGLGLSRHACILPLATLLENIAGVYVPLSMGATVDLLPLSMLGMSGSSGLVPRVLINQLQRLRPNSLILVPELATVLVGAAAQGQLAENRFRFLAVGGAKVPPSMLAHARQLGLPLYEGYGLSECGSVVALNVPGHDRTGAVGKPLDHLCVSIGSDGEIGVNGSTHLGYLGGSAQEPDLLRTGDLGHLDADGYLYVDGRRKNLLITSFGRNISPEWLESELTLATGACQAFVFGDGEPQPSALLALGENQASAHLVEALHQLNQSLPDYARLRTAYLLGQPLSRAQGYLTANGRLIRGRILAHLNLILLSSQRVDIPLPHPRLPTQDQNISQAALTQSQSYR